MDPKPTLVKLDLKDQQFKFLFAVEKVLIGVGLLVGLTYLTTLFPVLATQLNPLVSLLATGAISHFIVDLYSKKQFDKMVSNHQVSDSDIPGNETPADDSQTDSTN